MRIMYVEDNEANYLLVQRIAKMGHHEVINYVSAEIALENFFYDNPDLLMVDLKLAGDMDGIEMIHHVRNAGYERPVVVVTAYAFPRERELSYAAGCDEFIAKPLDVHSLLQILQ